MSNNFSQIKSILSTEGSSSLHRHVFILAGKNDWQKNSLKEILSGHENDSLWVGEDKTKDYPFVDVTKARTWLGKEKYVVIFDANRKFNPDSFAAISGIVVGGGLFFLLLPEKKIWTQVYDSPFGSRLIQSINQHADLVIIEENNKHIDFTSDTTTPTFLQNYDAPFLTLDQQHAVESIQQELLENMGAPIVLVSDRGRGKSAALGITIARLLQSGVTRISITAPRLSATDIIFKHIEETLSDAVVTRGCVQYGEAEVKFYSPDNLIQENIDTDILFVDEAAAIPVQLLSSFLNLYPQCVFATTVHGYEGTGRGFSLRFHKELDKRYKNWLKLQMQTPIRWAENDSLENWMFDLLCLDAEINDLKILNEFNIKDVKNILLNKNELKDNARLKEIFSLLVIAHYRTRPKDLKSILDDDDISVYVSSYNSHVIAVALVIHEGRFSNELSSEVYQGNRRPKGHLLAQTLTYHCGIENAATLNYARIMRIAVHPELQHKGLGTGLINFIVSSEKHLGRDAIGTSFGMNVSLLDFWKKSNFDVVRIGFTREQTSGEHAAIMLLALSTEGEEIKQAAYTQFSEKSAYWFDDVLKDIPYEIKNTFKLSKQGKSELTALDEKDQDSFVHYSRNYELCISSIIKSVLLNEDKMNADIFPEKFRVVLKAKVKDKLSWKQISEKLSLSGQAEARKLFHQAFSNLTTAQ